MVERRLLMVSQVIFAFSKRSEIHRTDSAVASTQSLHLKHKCANLWKMQESVGELESFRNAANQEQSSVEHV